MGFTNSGSQQAVYKEGQLVSPTLPAIIYVTVWYLFRILNCMLQDEMISGVAEHL